MSTDDLHHLFQTAATDPRDNDAVRARWQMAAAQERRAYGDWMSRGGTEAWIAWLAAADRVDAAVAELAAASRGAAGRMTCA